MPKLIDDPGHLRLRAAEMRALAKEAQENPHATPEEAQQSVEFAAALGNILFVLPSRVRRGLEAAGVAAGVSEAKAVGEAIS